MGLGIDTAFLVLQQGAQGFTAKIVLGGGYFFSAGYINTLGLYYPAMIIRWPPLLLPLVCHVKIKGRCAGIGNNAQHCAPIAFGGGYRQLHALACDVLYF